MNNKIAINAYISTQKISEQKEQKQTQRYRDHFMVARWEDGCGGG